MDEVFKTCYVSAMKLKFIIMLILSTQAFAKNFSLNDLSILMPLSSRLLKASDLGGTGELLPKNLLYTLPELTSQGHEVDHLRLKVVGIRIDPLGENNLPQIRLVFQPVENLEALDAAVHASYNLSENEFHHLLENLPITPPSDLQVHPVLKKEKLKGSYTKKLFGLILSKIGVGNLTKITFMASTQDTWDFGGVEINGGHIQPMTIPRILNVNQRFQNAALIPDHFFNGAMIPFPKGADTFNLLVQNSLEISIERRGEVLKAAIAAARVENPKIHHIQSIDCVSCHTAQMARLWAVKNFPINTKEFEYTSKFSLKNTSPFPFQTRNLRAFGYHGRNPTISQRTINETALVLEQLQK